MKSLPRRSKTLITNKRVYGSIDYRVFNYLLTFSIMLTKVFWFFGKRVNLRNPFTRTLSILPLSLSHSCKFLSNFASFFFVVKKTKRIRIRRRKGKSRIKKRSESPRIVYSATFERFVARCLRSVKKRLGKSC